MTGDILNKILRQTINMRSEIDKRYQKKIKKLFISRYSIDNLQMKWMDTYFEQDTEYI